MDNKKSHTCEIGKLTRPNMNPVKPMALNLWAHWGPSILGIMKSKIIISNDNIVP